MIDSTLEEIQERQRIDREIFLTIAIVAYAVSGILAVIFW
jgi:predicted HTH domain antitoxin